MPSGKNKVSLDSLPSDVLVNIFSYLPAVDLVHGVRKTCWLFNKLSSSGPLLKRVKIDSSDLDKYPNSNVLSKQLYLGMLHQKCVRNRNEDEGQSVVLRSNRLTMRHIVRSVVENKDVWPECSVTGQMVYPNLRQLKLWCYSSLQPTFLLKYGGLRHLELMISRKPDDNLSTGPDNAILKQLFEVLGTVLTKLETLTLQLPPRCKPSAADVQNYFRSGPRLRHVVLWFEVNDDIVEDIVLHCSQLKELKLSSDISADAFRAVSKRPNLSVSSLWLGNCKSADNQLLSFASLGFPNLTCLRLQCFVPNDKKIKINKGMRCLLERCRHLTRLNVQVLCNGSAEPEDDDAEEEEEEEKKTNVSEPGTDLSRYRKHYLFHLASSETQIDLHMLSLTHFNYRHLPFLPKLFQHQRSLRALVLLDCIVHDEDIQALADNCSLLRSFHIYNCKGIQVSHRTISTLWTLPHLQELQVDAHSFVENVVREDPPRRKRKLTSGEGPHEDKVSRLQTLVFPSSSLVCTPSRLDLFERTCHGLQKLTILEKENSLLNDDDLKVILRCCVHLHELQLGLRFSSGHGAQGKLSDASLRSIQIYGQKLQLLQLPHNPGITVNCLTNTVVQSPSLSQCIYAVFPKKVDGESAQLKNMTTTLNRLIENKLAKQWGDEQKRVEIQFPFACHRTSGTWVKFNVFRKRSDNGRRSLRPRKRVTCS